MKKLNSLKERVEKINAVSEQRLRDFEDFIIKKYTAMQLSSYMFQAKRQGIGDIHKLCSC